MAKKETNRSKARGEQRGARFNDKPESVQLTQEQKNLAHSKAQELQEEIDALREMVGAITIELVDKVKEHDKWDLLVFKNKNGTLERHLYEEMFEHQ